MYLKILLVGGNYFHANYLLSLKTDAQKKKHIYSTASYCLKKILTNSDYIQFKEFVISVTKKDLTYI